MKSPAVEGEPTGQGTVKVAGVFSRKIVRVHPGHFTIEGQVPRHNGQSVAGCFQDGEGEIFPE